MLSHAEKELVSQSEALEAMSDLFATYALAVAPSEDAPAWPYVTLPFDQFEDHAHHVTSFSYDGVVWIAPIVDDVTTWNTYCMEVMEGSDMPMSPQMFAFDNNGTRPVSGTGPFTPLHQVYPTPNVLSSINNGSIVNYNILSDPHVNQSTALVYDLDLLVLSRLLTIPLIRESYPEIFDETEPVSMLVEPIHMAFEETSEIVGYVQSIFKWTSFFSKFDGEGHSIICTIENTCGDLFAFEIEEQVATLVDTEYSKTIRMNDVFASSVIGIDDDDISLDEAREAGICVFTLTVFPSIEFRQSYDLRAALFATVIGLTMFVMVASFFAYD